MKRIFSLAALTLLVGGIAVTSTACGSKPITRMAPETNLELDKDGWIPGVSKKTIPSNKITWVKRAGNKPVEIEVELKHNGRKVDAPEDVKYITGQIDAGKSTKFSIKIPTGSIFGSNIKADEQFEAEADLRVMTEYGMLEKTTTSANGDLTIKVSPDRKFVIVSGTAKPSPAIAKIAQGFEVEMQPKAVQPDGDTTVSPLNYR